MIIGTLVLATHALDAGSIELGVATSNGSMDYITFYDESGAVIEGVKGNFDGTNITVKLPGSYNPSGKVKAVFSLTQNADGVPFVSPKNGVSGTSSGKAWNQRTNTYTTTLSSGSGSATVYYYNAKPNNWRDNIYDTYVISYTMENALPTLADGVQDAAASLVCGEFYVCNLDEVFTDADGDALTYTVKINGADAILADSKFEYTHAAGGIYLLEFFASDGKGTSLEYYTVTLTFANSVVTYDMTAWLPNDTVPVFYITNGYDANGIDILGEELSSVAGEGTDGYVPYTLSVPENISEISVRDAEFGGMAFSSASGSSVMLQKVDTEIIDFGDNGIAGTVEVSYGEYKATGIDGRFLLATEKEYTFSASPENTSIYNTKTEKVTVTSETGKVTVKVAYKNPKTVTTVSGADAKIFKYKGNYHIHTVYEPLATVDNGNGTSTHYFAVDGDISYRVSMEGKITKAGYMKTGNSVTVLYTDADALPTDRVDYTTAGTNASEVADDGLLLNINQQNHLSLAIGKTKTLKAYRAWQIIDLSYNNHIIEPDFHFNIISGEDVVSLAPYENQPMTNSSGNWQTLTAIGEGVAVIEVTYDAIEISGGSFDGLYGASDPARTGLFVVSVGGETPKVNFGIECKTSAGSMVYAPSNAKNWDAELDTLYFFGESGEIKLSPTIANGTVTEVAVSADKGATYTVLEEVGGVYSAPIVSGNNIIRVTTDMGVAYQIVRGDKLELEVKNLTHADKPIVAGDEVSLTLRGVHTPIPKISGTYNPGYKSNLDGDGGVHLHYSYGDDAVKSNGVQYNFSLYGTTLNFTLPSDGETAEFTLTDGYIGVGVIGVTEFPSDGESHRNIPDAGGTTRGSTTTFHTRSMLPDITVSVGMLPSGNTAPFVRESAPKTATVYIGNTYAVSMSKIFADRNGDTLTYTAKVGEGEFFESDEYFTFTPDATGMYVITFIANDGKADSDAHTVTLTVKEKATSSKPSLEFDIDKADIAGYVKVSFTDKGKRVDGEQNVAYPKALGTIISTKSVPFAKGDTVADVTLRLLDALDFTYEHSGDTKSGFYLSSIGNFTVSGVEYESLGEFDCGSGSGWMITLNGEFIEYGASDFEVENGDTIKWQYTCQLGADIGDPFYSNTPSTSKPKEEKKEDVKKNTYSKDTYSDVSTNAWYYSAAKYTYEYGLILGIDGKFNAEGVMTRAMLVTVLHRLDGELKAENAVAFVDVQKDAWYAEAVAWATEKGLVLGVSESEFVPDEYITREQLVTVVYRYAKYKGLDVKTHDKISGYIDSNEVSDYAKEAFSWALSNEFIGGTTEFTLSPKNVAIRGRIAVIAMNIREMSK